MKLSIIVPVYNMATDGKLQYCMDSLLNQTIQDYEIIAVDDCSTDDSFQVLQQYEQTYPGKIRCVRQQVNKKQGGARNTGLELAVGEWIGFIDSDDWIAPDMYEKLLAKAEKTGADVVGCDYHLTTERSMNIGQVVQNNFEAQTGILNQEKYGSLLMRAGSMVIKIYKHQVIKENRLRFPENTFYEDNYTGPVWMLCFKHFERVEEPLYYYYQHPGSTVHSISEERCRNRMDTAVMLVEECRRKGYDKLYNKELEFRFTEIYYYNTLFSYVSGGNKVRLSFVREIRKGMLKYFPNFQENIYYKDNYDAEQKRLVSYHMKSPVYFLIYYKLLTTYRKIRYGKNY